MVDMLGICDMGGDMSSSDRVGVKIDDDACSGLETPEFH